MKDKLNVYGVFIGDIFLLNYYGINVFLLVAKTKEDTVFVTEIESKKENVKGIDCDLLKTKLSYPKNPYIVKEDNTYTHTHHEIEPVLKNDEPLLPIKVDLDSELYRAAKKINDYIVFGTFFAYRIDNPYGTYFEVKTEKEYEA